MLNQQTVHLQQCCFRVIRKIITGYLKIYILVNIACVQESAEQHRIKQIKSGQKLQGKKIQDKIFDPSPP